MIRLIGLFLLTVSLVSTSTGQSGAAPATRPDPASLVQEVKEKYAKAKYYNVEAIKESELRSELYRQWDKSILSAAITPGNRYRFEGHNNPGWITKVSDGRSEWILDHVFGIYTEKAAPQAGPSKFEGPIYVNQTVLLQAQNLFGSVSTTLGDVLNPVLLENEDLTLGGKKVPCYVIRSRGKVYGGTPEATRQLTIWIDEETHTVRKVHNHVDGMAALNNPYERLMEDETTVYSVAALDVVSLPDALFKFQPPADAKLVDKFADPMSMPNIRLIGKPAADVSLQGADGKRVRLKEFRGKPVLLDFWATWCGPCVASLPKLEKLFQELSPKGLSLVSIDEDRDTKTAADLWSKRGEPWPNFHDATGEIQQQFPPGSMPEVVLIDASGKVTYTSNGFDESALRAAIAHLGPEFSAVDTKPGR
jgi:thiol-disulfide isomerase/thioredoxin